MIFICIDYRRFEYNRRKSHVRMDYTGSISDIDNRKQHKSFFRYAQNLHGGSSLLHQLAVSEPTKGIPQVFEPLF